MLHTVGVTVGVEMKRARQAKDWTQQQLADEVGVSRNTVIAWEKDRVKNPRAMRRALAALDADVELLPDDGTPSVGPVSATDLSDEQLLAVAQLHLAELASRFAARGGVSPMDGIPITLSRVDNGQQGDDQQQQ